MGDKATITVSNNTATISPPSITPDMNKKFKLDIGTDGWEFDTSNSAAVPPKAEGWTSVGNGLFVQFGSDFSLDKSGSTSIKVSDSGADHATHPQHNYLVCLTDGTNHINSDPVVIDRT